MIIKSTFKPAWWLANPHLQTIYPTLLRRRQVPKLRREQIELPDGDFLDLAWADAELTQDAPLVILLHGLGGGLNSAYAGGLLATFNQCGWRAVLMHFRGAGSEPNRLPRAYHSGDTEDVAYFLKLLTNREPHSKKAIVGVSLGGNVLLKWLGEAGVHSLVCAGVAVSVPFQLRVAADRMNQGLARIYQAYLLRQMRQIFARKMQDDARNLPEAFNNLQACHCFWTFDDQITAPLHGFANVHDYYRIASSRQYLHKITTPTLIVHALDDPFMSPEVLPASSELSKAVTLELSEKGGHVGFIAGAMPGNPVYWLEKRIPEFLRQYI
ncbi:hydrolase [Legionella septentrionalis]|uniref:hydrolase n=1 Tax=Legionella septentrionalis TaxID=2498109 RepID=UPI000F8E39D2|nr:hydrolase [Legionella septentrionalis]RUR10644.1 hydrolase [Legionella septentrionalis]